MADDLGKFIESQKTKLEKERVELSRNGDYATTSRQERSDVTPDKRREAQVPSSQPRATAPKAEETGMPLGGYERHQLKLREERKQEYAKFLAEKNMRSTGKGNPVLNSSDQSPLKEEPPHKSNQKLGNQQSYDRDYASPAPRNVRRGKENREDVDDYYESRTPRRRPVKTDSYDDLLRRKRAEERRYRGRFDEPDLDADIRDMKLSSVNYKSNSRSDGFLSRRYEEDDDDEYGSGGRSSRRNRGREPKRHVRFDDEDDFDDSQWVKPRRRRLDDYDDDVDGDLDNLREWSRRRQRPQRGNSAHEERRPPAPVDEDLRRTKTDSEIRSHSAPLLEGTGIIGGRDEPRVLRLQKQEQYRKELDKQREEHENMKNKEKMERFGVTPDVNVWQQEASRAQRPNMQRSEKQTTQADYDMSPGNYGPASRPQQHPSLHSNPYDDPYYYYGGLEKGAPQGPSAMGPSYGGADFGAPARTGYDGRPQQDFSQRSRAAPSEPPPSTRGAQRRSYEADPTHQPPGGFSNIGAIGGGGGGGDPDAAAAQKKKAAQQAYQEELRKQMEERGRKKEKDKQDKERYERKIEAEIANYNPWGKGGAGAPMKNVSGELVADLRQMHQYNQEGKIVSPRDAPPKDIRFELPPEVKTYSPEPSQLGFSQQGFSQNLSSPRGGGGAAGGVGASPFGRSDPLKEKQPEEDAKFKAKMEYQEYLKKQVEDKERQKKEELDKIKREEELEERRLEEQRIKMQKEFEKEQEKSRLKEEEVKRKNEEIKDAQEAKKKEADRKKKEMEERREEELRRKLDADIASKRAAGASTRSSSPPIPTLRTKLEGMDYIDATRTASPPVPALASHQRTTQSESPAPVHQPIFLAPSQDNRQQQVRKDSDSDVLSQLTALRQQLKNEEQKIQSQIGRSEATTKYQHTGPRRENDSRRSRRDVGVFDRVLGNKPGPVPPPRRNGDDFSAAEEFNKIKFEETSSLAGEFRSRFPQPVSSASVLDLQQQEYLREQEDKISALKAGMGRQRQHGVHQGRSKSRESLLESDSQFIAVDGPAADVPSMSQIDLRPRQTTARERRRWKQLEDMAKDTKPYDTYKPPTPGGFSLNSVTSFNVDDVANKNEERLRRLESIRRAEAGDPDEVLQQFMNQHRRPLTRASEASLEAETSFEPYSY